MENSVHVAKSCDYLHCLGLMELSDKVTRDLRDINDKKKEGEEAFQAKFGTRTPSQVCAALWKDANNYQTYHNQAVSLCVHVCFCCDFIDYCMFLLFSRNPTLN